MAVETTEQASKTALSSLILGMLGFPSLGITAMPGLIFGIIALGQINASNGRIAGKTVAVWGVTASILALLAMPPIMLLLFFPQKPRQVVNPARMTVEQKGVLLERNLSEIRDAVTHFYFDTGSFPADLDDLVVQDASEVTVIIPNGSFHGPYLPTRGGIANTGIPVNPFAYKEREIASHWHYDSGRVTSAVDGKLKDGRAFHEL